MKRLSSLALRNLRARFARTLLTALGIVLGVATILGVSITNQSTTQSFKAMIDTITGKADFWVEGASGIMDEQILSPVKKVPGVALALPSLVRDTRLAGKSREELQIGGIDPKKDRKLRKYVIERGRFLKSKDIRTILLVNEFAQKNRIEKGDWVEIFVKDGKAKFKVVGILKKEGAGNFLDGKVGFIPLRTAQKAFEAKEKISYLNIKVKKGQRVGRIAKEVKKALGRGYLIVRPEKRVEALEKILSGVKLGLSFFGAIAIFVGAFLVYNTFSMVVIERVREIGMLRALGTSKNQIILLILEEAVLLGLGGTLFGVLGGMGLALFLLKLMSRIVHSSLPTFSIPLWGLIFSVLVGLGVTLVSAFKPAILASRISPLEAVRIRSKEERSFLANFSWIPGLFLFLSGFLVMRWPETLGKSARIGQAGAFLFMMGVALFIPTLIPRLARQLEKVTKVLPVSGRLGLRNISRNPGRTAATTGAIMITLAMIMSVGGMNTSFKKEVRRWVDKSIGADVIVISSSPDVPIEKEFEKNLRDMREAEKITPVRYFQIDFQNSPAIFRAIEPVSYQEFATLQFVQGKKDEAFAALEKGGTIFLSTTLANKKNLRVGETVYLTTVKGKTPFKIGGIVVEFFGSMGEVVIGSWQDMKNYFEIDDVNAFRLKVKPGIKPAEVAQKIEKRYGKKRGLEVLSNQEFKEEAEKEVNASFAVFNAIVLLAVIVAALGVANTLLMNIIERVREIGILRAVGSTRSGIRRIILAEAAVMGTIGSLFGLLLGTYMSFQTIAAVQQITGFLVRFVFPIRTAEASLFIALLTSFLAALYPAEKAARTPIGRALQHE